MAYKVTGQPTEEPISLEEAKAWLKIGYSKEDSIITMLIKAERQYLEEALNLKLVTQAITQVWDRFPYGNNVIKVEANPVQEVTSITYKTGADPDPTFSPDNYLLDTTKWKGRIYLKEGKQWPETKSEPQSVTIVYNAGFGDASEVPDKYKKLLYHLIGFSYENRGNPIAEKRSYLDRMIKQERIWEFE